MEIEQLPWARIDQDTQEDYMGLTYLRDGQKVYQLDPHLGVIAVDRPDIMVDNTVLKWGYLGSGAVMVVRSVEGCHLDLRGEVISDIAAQSLKLIGRMFTLEANSKAGGILRRFESETVAVLNTEDMEALGILRNRLIQANVTELPHEIEAIASALHRYGVGSINFSGNLGMNMEHYLDFTKWYSSEFQEPNYFRLMR